MKNKIPFLLFAFLLFTSQAMADVFTDVSDENYNQEAIHYLKNQNIVQGYADDSYKPENRINRAEFSKILTKTLFSDKEIMGCTGSPFGDVLTDQWFAPYVCTAKKHRLVDGYPDGTFRPADFINFAEASKIIAEAQKLKTDDAGTNKEWFAGYVKALESKKAIPGTIQSFDKEITRGDMSEVIFRLKANRTDKVSATYEELSEALPHITSCPALMDKFQEYRSRSTIYYPLAVDDGVMIKDLDSAESAAPAAESTGSGGKAANDFSQTNIQVEGVDEADVIKNDGQYIYMVKGDTVRIVQAFPPTSMKEVARLDFDDDSFYPQELYINATRLVVIGQSSGYSVMPMSKMAMIMPPYYNSSRTKVFVYDIQTPSAPKEVRHVSFDGFYQTSRRIDNKLYLVLNANPNVWAWNTIKTGTQLVPQLSDGGAEPEAMVDCTDIRYFPGYAMPQYLITASFDLQTSNSRINRNVFLGSSDNVYASQNNLYVASTAYDYRRYTDWDWNHDETKTNIFRFSLKNGGIAYEARGTVKGTILNQFSMDEYQNHFRIATNAGNTWNDDNPARNNVYVLDDTMKLVGSLENLAKGERIYSTRFIGDRLYMVTFKQVDPLFVIDLSTPDEPNVLGELKIPGFSQYLHPYDDTHIIGFGQDTEQNQYGNTVTTGFKMALFDVSDVQNPTQQFVQKIGDSGTSSDLLYNHKALLFDKSKDLLAFPITIQEKVDPNALQCGKYDYNSCPGMCQARCIPTSCHKDANGVAVCTDDCNGLGSCTVPSYDRYRTTFSGALVYTLNLEGGFKERGRVSHYSDSDLNTVLDYFPYDFEKNIQRILYMGDYLYTIAQGGVKANLMDTVKEANFLKLAE